MTNEEAILHMILRREELKNSVGDLDEDIKAFDMAIRALELTQTGLLKDCESCKAELPCTDAISRQAAIDAIVAGEPYDMEYNLKMIRQLPSVSTEKIGYWIRCDILKEFKCSKCRMCFRYKSNFCPNCGAKMEVEE